MKFDMKRPCNGCPFLKGEGGPVRLTSGRVREVMHYAIDNPGASFPCHKSVNYEDEGYGDDEDMGGRPENPQERQCAGATIFSLRVGKPNQLTRVMGRLGTLKQLDLSSNVFDSEKEMLASALPDRSPRKRKAKT